MQNERLRIPDEFDPTGPIEVGGDASQVAQKIASGLQGVHLALETSTGLQAQSLGDLAIPSGSDASGADSGSARFGRLVERRDELVFAIKRATKFADDESFRLWALTRFADYREDEWRPATLEEAAPDDMSTSTVHRKRQQVDELIYDYAKKQGWTL